MLIPAGIALYYLAHTYTSKKDAKPSQEHSQLASASSKYTPLQQNSRLVKNHQGGLTLEYSSDNDMQFSGQVLPIARHFFSKLEKIGASPLQGDITTHAISKVSFTPTALGTNCDFIIDGKWVMRYNFITNSIYSKDFEGIVSFQARNSYNPYNWTKDTNQLQRLVPQNSVPMTEETAASKLNSIFELFAVRAEFDEPSITPIKPYGYDLNSWLGVYRIKGSDPLNQLNPQIMIGIQPTTTNSAILNLYKNTGAGWRYVK